MPLDEAVRRSTLEPARVLGMEDEIGSLAVGSVADVSVFDLEEGAFELVDSDEVKVTGDRKLTCYATVKDGRVSYRAT